MSRNGRIFYGLNQHNERVRYVKRSKSVNVIKYIKTNQGEIAVFNPYNKLYWEKEIIRSRCEEKMIKSEISKISSENSH